MADVFPISIEDLTRMIRQRVALQTARDKAAAARDPTRWTICAEFDHDVALGMPRWGRASRVAKRTKLPLRTVTRHVSRLNKVSQSV